VHCNNPNHKKASVFTPADVFFCLKNTGISGNQVFLKYKMIPFFTEYAECAIIKDTPCNFIFQHNRKQLHFVMCDAKNRKVCLVAKIYSKHYAPPERVVLFYIQIARR